MSSRTKTDPSSLSEGNRQGGTESPTKPEVYWFQSETASRAFTEEVRMTNGRESPAPIYNHFPPVALAPSFASLLQYATSRGPMPFTIRPFRRFPLCCPVTYHEGLSEGHGTIWNFSCTGWILSGYPPMRPRKAPVSAMDASRKIDCIAIGEMAGERAVRVGKVRTSAFMNCLGARLIPSFVAHKDSGPLVLFRGVFFATTTGLQMPFLST